MKIRDRNMLIDFVAHGTRTIRRTASLVQFEDSNEFLGNWIWMDVIFATDNGIFRHEIVSNWAASVMKDANNMARAIAITFFPKLPRKA